MKRVVRSGVAGMLIAALLGLMSVSPADAQVGAPTLSVGSTGHGVWCVQRILNRVYHWGLTEDASYGPQTRDAVHQFQTNKHIGADGIVGPITGTHLIDAVHGDNYCEQYLPTVN
jgi:zinc D-Ala-D-Ala carboxypeptidase